MNAVVHLKLTNDQDVRKEFPMEEFTGHFKLGPLSFEVNHTGRDIKDYQIKFIPETNTTISKICLSFNLDGFSKDSSYVYDAGTITNAFARIKKFGADTSIVSRDLFMIKDTQSKKVFNLAFTSFDRFFTGFRLENETVAAEYFLEDKMVNAGESYTLEGLAIDDCLDGLTFFDLYTQLLNEKYHISKMKAIPCGWSSWSCFYGRIDQDRIYMQAKALAEEFSHRGATLIQIDDGWQKEGSFGGYWTKEPNKFAGGIPALNEKITGLGLDFGLWYAPALLKDKSPLFTEHYDWNNFIDGAIYKSFGGGEVLAGDKDGSVYPLDLSKQEVLDYVVSAFRRGVEEYKSVYFKIDFLVNLLVRIGVDSSVVSYPKGYCVELYKHFVRLIRETVGDNVFLLACGAPIGESIGIFDSIRISPDITWGGASKPTHPGAWNLIRLNAQNAFLRSPYHGKVFINDPDGLVLRDYLSDEDDGLNMTEDEARVWATVVAMSGGHILMNEDLYKLRPERKELFRQIIPPYGKAAHPVDFFEFPYCTRTYIEIDNKTVKTRMYAVYNWDDEEKSYDIDISDFSRAIAMDCWTKEIVGSFEQTVRIPVLPPHSCKVLMVKEIADRPMFLYSDDSLYLGAKSVHEEYNNGRLSISSDFCEPANIYVLAPKGCDFDGEIVKTLDDGVLYLL